MKDGLTSIISMHSKQHHSTIRIRVEANFNLEWDKSCAHFR